MEFNSFSLGEFQLFDNVYPSSPDIDFLGVYEELEASRRVLLFGLLNVGFKLCTFFSNRLESLAFLVINFRQLVHLPFCERVVAIDFVVSGRESPEHSVDLSFIVHSFGMLFDVSESFGPHGLLKNVLDAQKESFLLFDSVSPNPENVSLFARILPIDSPAFQNRHDVDVFLFKGISCYKRGLGDSTLFLVVFRRLFLFKLDFRSD